MKSPTRSKQGRGKSVSGGQILLASWCRWQTDKSTRSYLVGVPGSVETPEHAEKERVGATIVLLSYLTIILVAISMGCSSPRTVTNESQLSTCAENVCRTRNQECEGRFNQ